jgi:hypothetical protein
MKLSTTDKEFHVVSAIMMILVFFPLFSIMLLADENNPITFLIPFGGLGISTIILLKYLKYVNSKKKIPEGSEYKLTEETK